MAKNTAIVASSTSSLVIEGKTSKDLIPTDDSSWQICEFHIGPEEVGEWDIKIFLLRQSLRSKDLTHLIQDYDPANPWRHGNDAHLLAFGSALGDSMIGAAYAMGSSELRQGRASYVSGTNQGKKFGYFSRRLCKIWAPADCFLAVRRKK